MFDCIKETHICQLLLLLVILFSIVNYLYICGLDNIFIAFIEGKCKVNGHIYCNNSYYKTILNIFS